MALPTDAQGTFKFWLNGETQKDVTSDGSFKYWLNGLPYSTIFSAGAPPAGTPWLYVVRKQKIIGSGLGV
jgi:hypothetical protein